MCYYKRKKDKNILIATKDIVVYKTTNTITPKGFKSYHKDFQYIFGKTYKTQFNSGLMDFNKIEMGFHSFSTAEYFNYEAVGKKLDMDWGSWKLRVENNAIYKGIIFKCIIPKGTRYWFNGTDYVSESIKLIKIVKPTKTYIKLLNQKTQNILNK